MAERWLKCVVLKGMFSDEVTVVITTRTGERASFFVPTERVHGSEGQEGRVRVRTFEQDSNSWAVVPNETQSIVPVDESQLATA